MKLSVILTISLLVTTGSVFATRIPSEWFTITEVINDGNGPVAVVPSVANPECPRYSWWIGQAGVIADGYKSAVSTLLTAFTTKKEIAVEYESATVPCYVYTVRMR